MRVPGNMTAAPQGGRRRVRTDLVDGQRGSRTPDTRIFSPLLYQLSYLAEGP